MTTRTLRGAMIGGGIGSLIGSVHRTALAMDGSTELVAGVFSRDAQRNRDSGGAMGVDPERCYQSVPGLIAGEPNLDWVSVMTPNNVHFEQLSALVRAGVHIIADKPLTATLEEAKELAKLVRDSPRTFVVTHAYTGYPMVRQARDLIAAGELGRVYKVVVEYFQGWLSNFHTVSDESQMPWRTQRAVSGIACTTADIGTHAENLARFITGKSIRRLSARTHTFLPANQLDDDMTVIAEYEDDVQGVLLASQVSTGERNALTIRVYGEEAGLEWRQEHPNQLTIKKRDLSHVVYDSGTPIRSDNPGYHFRLPPGHPEGLIEAFANVYRDAFAHIRSGEQGPDVPGVPGIGDGLAGMIFTDLVIRSSSEGGSWVEWPEE
ncbi:MAG TPA: Gfo/Idh/MocA family oxidoreductase [Alkalispirochaeta sp.]|nr:Gfo/Idh/MocA family oxidoreductase [Alkalispirochaeta sp.]